jgi:regulatory protein
MTTHRTLDCHERALRLLAVRPRSRRELEMRLRRAGFEPGEVETELVSLEDVGLVDDEAFARDLAQHHLAVRRSGRRAVESALAAKGVPRHTIQRALEDHDQDESARARALAEDRARRLSGLPPEKAYGRLVAFLARRGYEGGVARDGARRALRVDPDAE